MLRSPKRSRALEAGKGSGPGASCFLLGPSEPIWSPNGAKSLTLAMLGLTTAQLVYLNIQENSVRLEAKDLKAHSVYPKELTSLFPTTIRRTNRESPVLRVKSLMLAYVRCRNAVGLQRCCRRTTTKKDIVFAPPVMSFTTSMFTAFRCPAGFV